MNFAQQYAAATTNEERERLLLANNSYQQARGEYIQPANTVTTANQIINFDSSSDNEGK